jgi:hypothetical protein
MEGNGPVAAMGAGVEAEGSMNSERILRLRALDALEARAKQFRSREDLWPFRVPRAAPARPILDDALGRNAEPHAPALPDGARMEWAVTPAHAREARVPLPSGIALL